MAAGGWTWIVWLLPEQPAGFCGVTIYFSRSGETYPVFISHVCTADELFHFWGEDQRYTEDGACFDLYRYRDCLCW